MSNETTPNKKLYHLRLMIDEIEADLLLDALVLARDGYGQVAADEKRLGECPETITGLEENEERLNMLMYAVDVLGRLDYIYRLCNLPEEKCAGGTLPLSSRDELSARRALDAWQRTTSQPLRLEWRLTPQSTDWIDCTKAGKPN